MLTQSFTGFSSFLFNSRYLYSAYVLLIVLSLALSAFSCVHFLHNKCALPLPITIFKHSRFLYSTVPYFDVSTVSPKKSSSFSIVSISVIAFITCRDLHHIKNRIKYKSNNNDTSVVIIFFNGALVLF